MVPLRNCRDIDYSAGSWNCREPILQQSPGAGTSSMPRQHHSMDRPHHAHLRHHCPRRTARKSSGSARGSSTPGAGLAVQGAPGRAPLARRPLHQQRCGPGPPPGQPRLPPYHEQRSRRRRSSSPWRAHCHNLSYRLLGGGLPPLCDTGRLQRLFAGASASQPCLGPEATLRRRPGRSS
jgi:hypothetical protein